MLNDKLMKGTPFETKTLSTTEIGNVEVSEKMPTLAIEVKPETITSPIRRATVVEVPEEVPTLVANPEPIPEKSDAEPLKAATLDFEDEPKEDDMVIAYIKGEPVIGIFDPTTAEPPLTLEYDAPKYSYSKNTRRISRIMSSRTSPRFCLGQGIWIRAKTSISQKLAHDNQTDRQPRKSKDTRRYPSNTVSRISKGI